MRNNSFAFYRKRIRQSQEKIAEVLNIPLYVYIEFEENRREPPQRVREAFGALLTRIPGSIDLAKPKIQAIDIFKRKYFKENGRLPTGKHWIPFNFVGCKQIFVDFSPFEKDSK